MSYNKTEQPPAEGAEEFLLAQRNGNDAPITVAISPEGWVFKMIVRAMEKFATLHAQRIAEGAEEILPTAYEWHNYKTGHCYVDYIPHLDAKEGYVKTPLYTTIHAQRLAEKMVEEKLKYNKVIQQRDELREALVEMIWQFGYRGTYEGRGNLHSGGLSALESAFDALGISDPITILDFEAAIKNTDG